MNRKCNRHDWFFAIGIMWLVFHSSEIKADQNFEIEQLASGVYVHLGKQEQITYQNKGDIANLGFIIGEQSVAVIDAGGSQFVAQSLIDSIKLTTDLPVRYLILTHAHPDHIFGTKSIANSFKNIEIIGHKHFLNALVQRGEFYRQRFINEQGFAPEDLTLLPPDTMVETSLEIDLGGRLLTLYAFPTSHTDNDLVVVDKQSKTIWTGDLIFRNRVPVIDGNVKNWLNTMDELSKIDVNFIVPGHGPVAYNWAQALDNQRRYLSKIIEGVRQKLKKGGTIQSAVESVALDENQNWLLFKDHHGQNVSRVFSELEWE